MLFDTIVAGARHRLDKRRQYNRLVQEIESMSARDLADIRGDRSDMLQSAYRKIYG